MNYVIKDVNREALVEKVEALIVEREQGEGTVIYALDLSQISGDSEAVLRWASTKGNATRRTAAEELVKHNAKEIGEWFGECAAK